MKCSYKKQAPLGLGFLLIRFLPELQSQSLIKAFFYWRRLPERFLREAGGHGQTERHRIQLTAPACLPSLPPRQLSLQPWALAGPQLQSPCTALACFKFQGRGWGQWPWVGGFLCSRRMPSGQGQEGAQRGGPVFVKRGRKFLMEAAQRDLA